jgi:GntR family transcriptional regulator/MocR family aminotransferase
MKLAGTLSLALPPKNPGVPAYRWVYLSLRSAILEGRLGSGARLPATRELATQYALARGTIVNAYEQLKSEGYVEGSAGSGTYVSRVLPERWLEAGTPAAATAPKRPRAGLSDYARRTRLFEGYENRPARAFRPNLPALDLLPWPLWTKLTARCLRRVSTGHLLGCDPFGYLPLRQAVADYLARARGVRCDPGQIAIVSGVQEALDLAGRLLLNPGDRVCMENPGYPGAAKVFEALGAEILAAPVDAEGMEVPEIPARNLRLVYVTPGHQFPSGTTMSLARRLELLAWARKSRALLFEDDYDSEYRYAGRPIPALQGLGDDGTVLYAGSFSKVLFPALRLGYLVLPQALRACCEAARSLTCRHPPLLEQLVLTDFIREGHFGRHLRRMRQAYARRLGVLLEEGGRHLAGLLEISTVEAGLQTTGWLSSGIAAESAAAEALRRNVEVTPIGRYASRRGRRGGAREGLQIGFAAVDEREIRRGVRDLAAALESLARRDRFLGKRPSIDCGTPRE